MGMNIIEIPWQGTSDELLQNLDSSKNGLSEIEAGKRLFKFGANTILKHTPTPYLQIIFDQFVDLLVLLLIFSYAEEK